MVRFRLHPLKRITAFLAACALCFTASPAISATETADNSHALLVGPGENTAQIASFSDGDTVTLLETVYPDRAHIRLADGTAGYCDAAILGVQFTNIETEEFTAYATVTNAACTVRSSPDAGSAGIAKLPKGACVRVTGGAIDGFCAVILKNDRIGYLPEDLLTAQYEQAALVRTVPEFPETGAKTEEEAAARLSALSAYFEHGKYWNCVGTARGQSKENLFTLTDLPCDHPSYGYTRCNIYSGGLCEPGTEFSTGMQCFGYVNLLSDLVFGKDAPVYVHDDFEKLRVGDHIRLVLWDHSMLVTEVCRDENGEVYVYVTDVNADYDNCQIQWGRKFTQRDLRRLGDYIRVQTRYPLE